MRAAQLHRPASAELGPLTTATVPDPRPTAGEVLVEVRACAVCRTDLQLCEGDLEAHRLPIVPGHQITGRVIELGEGVTDLAVGDRVGIAWIASTCGRCRFCTSGRENLCLDARFTGWDRDGGYAELVTADARFVVRLPEGFDDIAAAPLLCGGSIGYRSLRVAGVGPGSNGLRLGLFGFGASATLVVQIARHWGCEVHVCTRSEAEQARAIRLGAHWAGSYDEVPPSALDAAITFAPAGDVVVHALRSLDRGGTLAINAIHLDRVPEFPYALLWWERTIRSVANVTRADVAEMLTLAAELQIRTETQRFDREHPNDALLALRDGRVSGAAVLC